MVTMLIQYNPTFNSQNTDAFLGLLLLCDNIQKKYYVVLFMVIFCNALKKVYIIVDIPMIFTFFVLCKCNQLKKISFLSIGFIDLLTRNESVFISRYAYDICI